MTKPLSKKAQMAALRHALTCDWRNSFHQSCLFSWRSRGELSEAQVKFLRKAQNRYVGPGLYHCTVSDEDALIWGGDLEAKSRTQAEDKAKDEAVKHSGRMLPQSGYYVHAEHDEMTKNRTRVTAAGLT